MRNLLILLLLTFTVVPLGCRAQYAPVKVNISTEITTIDGVSYYVHTVEKRQTLYSISRSYNVSAEILINDNPELKQGLKEGDKILIRRVTDYTSPEKVTTPAKQAVVKDTVSPVRIQADHLVRWYENLASISKKYGVTEEEIAIVNSLSGGKIQARQVLKIPYPGEAERFAQIQRDDIKPITEIKSEEPDDEKIEAKRRRSGARRGSYTASLIIPMGGRDSASTGHISGNFVEFYQGFLIALEDLKEEFSGINLELRVFDSDRIPASEIALRGDLKGSDLIIGPVLSAQIEPVLSFAHSNDIPLVSPVDPSGDELSVRYPNYFHVGTPVAYQQKALIESVSASGNIVLIFEEGGQDSRFVQITRQMLQDAGLRYKTLSYTILGGRSILPQFENRLVKEGINQIIVASNSEAFVSDVLRNLNLMQSRSGYSIKLFGTPWWRHFDNVDINLYHTMNLSISMQYYVEYNSENVKRFIARFRELYNAEPTAYSFQAYDVAYFFLGALYNYGGDIEDNIGKYNRKLLQSDYKFIRRNGDEGFINSGVRVLKYRPDFSTDTGSPGL
ncbi:MAG: LysM peptidoglycan-binding domain-containing protein [Bacteroidales bacterium]|nr:LysM peptidoglycan-binding domain-containing protein [Bacteroidales bacterium]